MYIQFSEIIYFENVSMEIIEHSYWIEKQDFFNRPRKLRGWQPNMDLCLKVNRTRWKCHMNRVGGMPEGSVITRI